MGATPAKERNKTRNKRKRVLVVLGIILALLVAALLFAGNYFYGIVINWNKTNNYAIGYDGELKEGAFDNKRYEALHKESLKLPSKYGYDISGTLIQNSTPTHNTVILVHGIGQDKWNSLKYGDIFLDEGYNIFIFDNRNHGDSGGGFISYGSFEKDDLQSCVKYIRNRYPDGSIGIHGESLGAATAMLYAQAYAADAEKDVSFYVEDCGWADLRRLYVIKAADFMVPAFLRPALIESLSLVCRARAGFSLDDASPIKKIDQVKTPMLFIHGDRDDFIPPSMVTELYNKKTGIKALYIAKGAGHACSLSVDKARYKTEIVGFLKNIKK